MRSPVSSARRAGLLVRLALLWSVAAGMAVEVPGETAAAVLPTLPTPEPAKPAIVGEVRPRGRGYHLDGLAREAGRQRLPSAVADAGDPGAIDTVGEVGLIQRRPPMGVLLGYSGATLGLFAPEMNVRFGEETAAPLALPDLGTRAALDQPALTQKPDEGRREEARNAAEQILRHLYTVYFGVRGCTEASLQFGRPEYLSSVTLVDARRTMRVVDAVAKEAGLDVDQIWADAAPLGLITAESLKSETPDHTEACRKIGSVFRVDLGNLQNALTKLGSKRAVIEKDF